jgi:predicted anti-sigma-YlaC factor YlaD
MTCDLFEELITPFLDAELAGSDLAAFRAHQMACTECRALLADVTAAVAACAEAPEVEPPLEILSRALVIPALNPPIDCARFGELVTEFLDGFLEASVYHAFEDHATACDDCSETLAGVALAVTACHSVHFSEEVEVPESLVASILAETSGGGVMVAEPRGVWGRLAAAFRLYAGPLWAPRFGTAAVIVAAFSMLVTEGGLGPASIYESAARVTSRVYSRSIDFASQTGRVMNEVERIRSDVDEMFGDDKQQNDPATDDRQKGAVRRPSGGAAA